MKKSILTTLITTTILTTSAFAANFGNGKGYMMDNLSADEIKARMEARVSANPNLKISDFEEKDGKYHFKIMTKDDSLVKEVTIDPKNPRQGFMGQGNLDTPMTVDQAKTFIDAHLQMMGNDNIKVGEVTQDGDMIKATIVTKDGSLVKELSIDPSSPRGMMSDFSGGMFGGQKMMANMQGQGMQGGMQGQRMKGGMQGQGMKGGMQGQGMKGGMKGQGMKGGMQGQRMKGGMQGQGMNMQNCPMMNNMN